MIRRLVRFLFSCLLLPLAACGYFSGDWPELKQDPLPVRTETPSPDPGAGEADGRPAPGFVQDRPPARTPAEAADRLAEYENRFQALKTQADMHMAALIPAPGNPAEWGRAQIEASRLTRTETDLKALRDTISADAAYLEQQAGLEESSAEYLRLARRVTSLVEEVAKQRLTVQTQLAARRPEDEPAPQAPATPLPEGRPALTIRADATAQNYSQAVTTLVEKARAISGTTVYHVVAASGEAAAERARNVRSLLAAGGVLETRIRLLTDPAAEPGSLRIYVE